MKKLIFGGFICCFQTVWAAEPSLTISGVITDAADIPLSYVNVKAQSDIVGKMFVAQSDANGEYKMAVSFTDSCVVTYSYIGYKSLTYIFYKTSDETTVNDVCMSEDTTALKEVVVNGRIAVHGQDKTIFFPTEA